MANLRVLTFTPKKIMIALTGNFYMTYMYILANSPISGPAAHRLR